jgi:hypothetical protein
MRWLLLFLLGCLAAPAIAQQSAPEIPYESVPNFFKLPADMNFGEIAGVAVNSKGHIFVLSRSDIAGPAYGAAAGEILEFGPDGKYLRKIGKGLYSFEYGHAVRVDKQDNIWQVDKASNTVVKFNPEGHVILVLGRKVESADDRAHPPRHRVAEPGAPHDGLFDGPTDVAWDAAGNIYVSDGYQNSRVAKFDKYGNWITSWGSRGSEPGQFDLPHNIAVDRAGNVYVADRSNARIQVFDSDGTFLRQFSINIPLYPGARHPQGDTPAVPETTGTEKPGSAWVLCMTDSPAQYMYTADHYGRFFKLDLNGKVLGWFGRTGQQLGQFGETHAIACPSENELYEGEITTWRVQKLILHPERQKSDTNSNR